MTRRTLAELLDDSVRWTGIPAMSERPVRRRPLRLPSTMALSLAGAGFATMAASGFAGRLAAIGYAILMIGFAIGVFVRIFGPLKHFGTVNEQVDELDRAVRARAYLVTFAVFAATTIVGLFAIMATLALGQSVETTGRATMALFFVLMTILSALPTAHASWSWRWEN